MKIRVLVLATVMLLMLAQQAVAQTGANWPQWRGPNRDGISKETGLLKQWPAEGPALVWKASGAGRGYSSFSISDGKLYTMGLRGDREFVVAFDIATGKEAWASPHGSAFRNDRGDGPRGTPTIDGDRVYARLMRVPANSPGPRMYCVSLAVRISRGESASRRLCSETKCS
jgi:hypothetical protein